MPINPAGSLSQYRTQIDQNELDISNCLTIAEANANVGGSGYGGILLNSNTPLPTIDTTWQTLTGYGSGLVSTPRDVTQDFSSNGLLIGKAGVWSVYAKITLTFDEVNSGRALQMRLLNLTDAIQVIPPIVYFIARNQGGINIVFNRLLDVPPEHVGDLFQLQVNSSADTFTNVANINTVFQTNYVDLYQGF